MNQKIDVLYRNLTNKFKRIFTIEFAPLYKSDEVVLDGTNKREINAVNMLNYTTKGHDRAVFVEKTGQNWSNTRISLHESRAIRCVSRITVDVARLNWSLFVCSLNR
jgi:hypothetical protein